MKLTVTQWTQVQNRLLDMIDEKEITEAEGHALYDYLEYRTFGKRYSQPLAIALKGNRLKTVEAALKRQAEKEHSKA